MAKKLWDLAQDVFFTGTLFFCAIFALLARKRGCKIVRIDKIWEYFRVIHSHPILTAQLYPFIEH